MDVAFDKQDHLVTEERVDEHTKLYEDADKAYAKASDEVNAIIYVWKPPNANVPPIMAQATPRVIENLKPTTMLTGRMSLEAFRHWPTQYKNLLTLKRAGGGG